MNIYLKKIFILFVTQAFSVEKIYFSNKIYIFYIFIYIFLCKKVFFSKIFIQYKTFSHIKTFFSANNVYFVKNANIFSKKKFNLVLQQMNNHTHHASALKIKEARDSSDSFSFKVVTTEDVGKEILALDASKAIQSDDVPTRNYRR